MMRVKTFATALLLAVVTSSSLALIPNNPQENQSIAFADSALECAIYYEYTAGGLEKNPNVARKVVQSVTRDSKTLLHTADLLYHAAGISIADKREEFIQRAKIMIKEKQEDPGSIDELIYEFGDKCKRLMATYSYRIKNIAGEPNSI